MSENQLSREDVIATMHLNFKCQRCGVCCTKPDEVLVTSDDVSRLSKFLGIRDDAFYLRYTNPSKHVPGKFTLSPMRPCVFYNDDTHSCEVYKARPGLCRLFPVLSQLFTEGDIELPEECQASNLLYERLIGVR